eukprot:GFUD01019665.1.p1 GENE.GFUD01019665.1~~GFUD01019665.1.p1  ORF type:complete len:1012 (+),score=359.21 GFUD01019665.1:1015-4050(+)
MKRILMKVNEPNNVAKDTTKGFASELSSKLGLSKSKPVKEISEDNDQDAMDTSDDETDAQPKPKKIVKLPPKKSVLFDSSDSDDDLFSPKPRANPPQNQAKIPSPKGMKKTDTGSPKKLPPLPPPAKSKPNLDAKEIEKASSPIRPVVSAPADPDVESQSDDDFFSAISSKVTKSVSLNTKDDVAAKPTAGKSLFGDSSDEDDIFSDIKIGSKGKESSSDLVAASQKKSLFDNSDDSDDLFADLMAKTKKTKPVEEAMLKTDDNPKTNAGRKPIGGTPMFGGMTPAMVTAKSDHEDTSDETENIFSPVVNKASPPPVPSAASKPIMEIDNSTKENSHSPMIGILGENDAQTVPTDNHKKPIGGVSLFGGIDPFKKEKSDLKDEENTSDETEDKFSPVVKKALPTSVPVAASKPIKEIDNSSKEISPSPMTPVMVTAKSDNEDEDTSDETEDIFSPVVKKASPPPVPSAASKPIMEIDNSTKENSHSPMIGILGENDAQTVPTDNHKKPIGGVSLFGGIDPFKKEKSDLKDEENTSDETEDIFSPVVKKASPTPVPAAASKPIKEIDNSAKEIPPSPMTPVMVTAKSDNEDEDTSDETKDIFSPVVKKAAPPPVPSAASKPIKEIDNSAKDISQSPMIGTFGDNEGQTVPTDNLRKPFGGVSLFGGFDPSKREKSDFQDGLPPDEDDVKEITSEAKIVPSIPPASSKPKHKEESKSTEKIESPVLNNVLDENSHQIVNSKKPAGGISMFGGFDPKKFMKTSQDDEAGDISNADDTVDSKEPDDPTETLITLTKSRPKMKGGRRPPTRAGRKNAVKESNALSFDVIDGPISVEKGSGELKTNLNNSAVEIEKKPSKAPIGGVSMFNGFNPAELIRPKKTTKNENLANFEDLNNTTEVEILTAPGLKDDEIKEITSAKEDMSAVSDKSESTSPLVSEFDDQESISFEPPPMSTVDKEQSKSNNLFGFDDSDTDDDMFSNMATSAKQTLKPDPMANIFGDDSDDDLFSSLISKKS